MDNPKPNLEKIELERLVNDYSNDTSWLREYNLDINNPDKEKIRDILKRDMSLND